MDTKNNILDNETGNLPDGWEIKKLGDVVDINKDSLRKLDNLPFVNYLDTGNIFEGRINEIQKLIVGVDKIPSRCKRKVILGDILYSTVRPNQKHFGFLSSLDENMIVSTGFCVIHTNESQAHNKYVYYYLTLDNITAYLQSIAEQSKATYPSINPSDLLSLNIALPPIEEQKEIAAILSSLDDKIKLNQQINKKLEEMAQAIFKEWFIDFNFPDENGNPYRDSGGAMIDSELGFIPASWSVGKLGDYVTIKRGGSPRPIQEYLSDCGLRWLKISDATATVAPFIFDIKEFIKESGISKTVLLNKGSLVLSNSATPGIPKILAVDSCIHDGWLYFQNSKFSNEFLYLLFKDIRVQLVQQGNGSVFTNLKTDIVKSHLMAIPNNILLNKFNELASIVFLQMKSNCQQINNLTRLRNMLLPKLISGFFNH